jgi:predicted membrane protein
MLSDKFTIDESILQVNLKTLNPEDLYGSSIEAKHAAESIIASDLTSSILNIEMFLVLVILLLFGLILYVNNKSEDEDIKMAIFTLIAIAAAAVTCLIPMCYFSYQEYLQLRFNTEYAASLRIKEIHENGGRFGHF